MSAKTNPFETDLDKNPANYAPLTPLSFIERTAYVYPKRIAVIHGARRYTWEETYARCRRLASALAKRGIGAGDTVAVMLANTPEMYECHFGVPMTGGVLNSLNTRLDAAAIAFMLQHGEAKVLITDREFSPTVKAALAFMKAKPEVIDVDDSEYAGPGERLGDEDLRRAARRRAIRSTPGSGRPTSGTRSRSTTPPAPRAIRRAWSTTTAAPT